jgi:hypothetical protein
MVMVMVKVMVKVKVKVMVIIIFFLNVLRHAPPMLAFSPHHYLPHFINSIFIPLINFMLLQHLHVISLIIFIKQLIDSNF